MTVRNIAANHIWNTNLAINSMLLNRPNFGVGGVLVPSVSMGTNAHIRSAGAQMQAALRGAAAAAWDTFPRLDATSTHGNIATVSIDQSRFRPGQPNPRELRVNVLQVADAQIRRGREYDGSNMGPIAEGLHQFAIQQGGITHNFEVEVQASMSIGQIQEEMLAAINERNMGVRAAITADGALELTSQVAGAAGDFIVSDIGAGANLAYEMGITGRAQNPGERTQNAIFTIDGGMPHVTPASTGNTISLEPWGITGGTMDLRREGQTFLNFTRDAGPITGIATDIVNSINFALQVSGFAGQGSGVRGVDRFLDDIRGALGTYSSRLADVGISVGAGGRLTINQHSLRSAAEEGRLEGLFGPDATFVDRMGRIAADAAASGRYVTGPTMTFVPFAVPMGMMPNPFMVSSLNFGNTMPQGFFFNRMS